MEITKITNSVVKIQGEHMLNRASSSFLNVDHSATQTELKHILNTHKVKRYRNCDTKTGNIEPKQNYRIETVSNELLGL